MSTLDVAALERLSRPRGRRESSSERVVTADVLGRIIACAWRVENADDIAVLLTPEALSARILRHADTMPEKLRDVLHIDRRVDGDEVEEASYLVLGAQSAGVLGRLNPTHATAMVKADALQAYAILDRYEAEYPEVVAWAKKIMQAP
jgi:hypothetical protein